MLLKPSPLLQNSDIFFQKIVRRPVDYLLSIPGKDIRGKLIDAFNEWLQVPREKLAIIKDIIDMLHTASLLFVQFSLGDKPC